MNIKMKNRQRRKQDFRYKSLSVNAVLNGVRSILKMIFPLITFPYVSRILGVDNIGKYNFSVSVVKYFNMIAALGIVTYAVREGAAYREEPKKLEQFSNEIFSINVCSTFFSYFLLGIILVFAADLHSSAIMICILSIQIVYNTIGIEWIYTINEDFFYITMRSIAVQVVSIFLMFLFVKSEKDLYIYTIITVAASVGGNIFNWIYARKYCKIRLVKKMNIKKHLKPILVIFATTITVSIYSTSDVTILGLLCNDYAVGLYSVSVKIYDIVKSALASVIIVSVPRLASYLGEKEKNNFEKTAGKIYKILISFAVPAVVGLILLSKDIIYLLSGNDYLEATASMIILSFAILFNVSGWFWGQCVLIPMKKEKVILAAAIITTIINVGLNFILIPFGKQDAAAVTTVIAEIMILLIQGCYGKKYIRIADISSTYIKAIAGSAIMGFMILFLGYLVKNSLVKVIISIPLGVTIYFLTEWLMKNEEFIKETASILNKWQKRRKENE